MTQMLQDNRWVIADPIDRLVGGVTGFVNEVARPDDGGAKQPFTGFVGGLFTGATGSTVSVHR